MPQCITPARVGGLVVAVIVLIGLAIWQPWHATHLGERDAPRTILLLTLDALRRDHVGAYTPDGATAFATTPHLDGIAARAVRFADARTPVPLTLPSHTTMLAGLPPASTGVRLNSMRVAPRDARPYPFLQERLRDAGWRTGAFVSAATLAQDRGLAAGFEAYDDGGLGNAASILQVPERRGDETVARALTFLERVDADERVFLFIHLFEPHHPYVTGSYRGDCEDGDRIVGVLLEGLEAAGRSDAVILVTADHGEALGELGERTHGILLSDGAMRVPMLLALGADEGQVRTDPVDVADVAPTLAAIAGIAWDAADRPGAGRDLLAGVSAPDRARVAESLYGHHRYGWAQLVGAVRPNGVLVDAGAARAHWLPLQPFGEDLTGTLPGDEAPDIEAANILLLAYRDSEVAGLMSAGPQAGGYGAGGPVSPFLPDEVNALLPDPHLFVTNADRLDQLAAGFVDARAAKDRAALREIAGVLERMLRADATNREAWFRLGRVRVALGQAEAGERAFLKAWELGRRDEGTLLLCCGANAVGREAEMLVRLEALGQRIQPRTIQMWLLEAQLHRALGNADGFDEACRRARGLARSERDRALVDKVCPPR